METGAKASGKVMVQGKRRRTRRALGFLHSLRPPAVPALAMPELVDAHTLPAYTAGLESAADSLDQSQLQLEVRPRPLHSASRTDC